MILIDREIVLPSTRAVNAVGFTTVFYNLQYITIKYLDDTGTGTSPPATGPPATFDTLASRHN